MPVSDFSSPSSGTGQYATSSSEFAPLSRYRRGRKTETSSDASRENLAASQVFLQCFPWPQGRRSRGDRPTSWSRQARPSRAGNLSAATIWDVAPSRVGETSIPKIRPANGMACQKTIYANPLSPAGLPGFSQPGVCLMALCYTSGDGKSDNNSRKQAAPHIFWTNHPMLPVVSGAGGRGGWQRP